MHLQFFLGACGAHDVALPNVLRNGGHEPLVNVSVAFEEVLGARRRSTPSATLLPVNGICPDCIRSLTDESPRRMKRTVECRKGGGALPGGDGGSGGIPKTQISKNRAIYQKQGGHQ